MPATPTQQQQPHLAHAHAQSSPVQYVPKHAGGRPRNPATHWNAIRTPANADLVCQHLIDGKPLISICSDLGINYTAVFAWINEDDQFAQRYAQARELQCERMAEQIIELADSATPETAQAVRLQVDSRKWFAGKMHSRKFGDRPADIQINTQVNVTLPEAELRSLQQRKLLLLEERQAKAMPAKARLLSI